MLLKHI